VRIELSNPALAWELACFLNARECVAQVQADGAVEASPLGSFSAQGAVDRLAAWIAVWEARTHTSAAIREPLLNR
jgi:hypothetical protein